tara:strand:+ start:29075 stop:29368 length:294 start_codon:yes stop_codon:yes gene_type:complete
MNYFLIFTICLSIILLISLYYNYKFAKFIFGIEDAIEASLENLDERYDRIQKVLDTPLFFDSPQVRQVLEDIKSSRDSVLDVANQLTRTEDGEKEEN